MVSCLITAILSTIFAIVSLKISSSMFDIYKNTTLNFTFKTISLGFLIMIAYSLFISGLCIAIASLSKTYKEAQSALTPISLLTMIPMLLDILKIDMTSTLALIPVVNHTMILKALFCDSLVPIHFVIMIVTSILYVIIIIKVITKQYKSEKVLFS